MNICKKFLFILSLLSLSVFTENRALDTTSNENTQTTVSKESKLLNGLKVLTQKAIEISETKVNSMAESGMLKLLLQNTEKIMSYQIEQITKKKIDKNLFLKTLNNLISIISYIITLGYRSFDIPKAVGQTTAKAFKKKIESCGINEIKNKIPINWSQIKENPEKYYINLTKNIYGSIAKKTIETSILLKLLNLSLIVISYTLTLGKNKIDIPKIMEVYAEEKAKQKVEKFYSLIPALTKS